MKPVPTSPAALDAAVAAYAKGATLAELAALLDVSSSTVWRRLGARGVERKRGPIPRPRKAHAKAAPATSDHLAELMAPYLAVERKPLPRVSYADFKAGRLVS